jgi:hypothetical protein
LFRGGKKEGKKVGGVGGRGAGRGEERKKGAGRGKGTKNGAWQKWRWSYPLKEKSSRPKGQGFHFYPVKGGKKTKG